MTDQNAQVHARQTRRWRLLRPDGWTLAALVIAALVLAPVVSVLWIAFHPTENIWPHLAATVLPRYMNDRGTMIGGELRYLNRWSSWATSGATPMWPVSKVRYSGAQDSGAFCAAAPTPTPPTAVALSLIHI